jgi:hypothetical protein
LAAKCSDTADEVVMIDGEVVKDIYIYIYIYIERERERETERDRERQRDREMVQDDV